MIITIATIIAAIEEETIKNKFMLKQENIAITAVITVKIIGEEATTVKQGVKIKWDLIRYIIDNTKLIAITFIIINY